MTDLTRGPYTQRWLGGALGSLPRWPYGELRAATVEAIGAGYGMSGGAVYRVAALTRAGNVTFVLKHDTPEATRRALLFHESAGERLGTVVPTCYGGVVESDRGFLFLDDIVGEQGDALTGCTDEQLTAAVHALAGIHAASWAAGQAAHPSDLPRWEAAGWDDERWSTRVSGARNRFPALLTPAVAEQLQRLPLRVTAAADELRRGPASWIHVDAHLDNVIWRADGSAVVLDWSGASIGPPAVDLARLSLEGLLSARQMRERRQLVVDQAGAELARRGIAGPDAAVLDRWLGLAIPPLLQGIVGWAGRPEESPPSPRMSAMRENALRNTVTWLTAF